MGPDIPVRSYGIATDLLIMRDLSQLEDRGNHLVLRTPSQPSYWYGNRVILRDRPDDPVAHVALSRRAFPDSAHICLEWDIPGLALGSAGDYLLSQGFDLDAVEFLVLKAPIAAPPLPAGLRFGIVDTASAWAQVAALQYETSLEDGYSGSDHRAFITRRVAGYRRLVETGLGCWFGVFDDTRLVADMGIFHDDRVARYQAVETRMEYRRRGICTSLLAIANEWAVSRAPGVSVLIAADPDSPAHRIYRRAGFAPLERISGAVKPGY
ncbi:GNAT family N-acetyltransferase [Limimaricola hongkongensis]|uniref:GNAT family N-acetyltransferase n=1 Tax=Limimaricola hongkongensis TaxID=278132 RepID=UPI000475EE6F|nr:GNAT family N-acetyltransferase [Limimaricola hongkongensis]